MHNTENVDNLVSWSFGHLVKSQEQQLFQYLYICHITAWNLKVVSNPIDPCESIEYKGVLTCVLALPPHILLD